MDLTMNDISGILQQVRGEDIDLSKGQTQTSLETSGQSGLIHWSAPESHGWGKPVYLLADDHSLLSHVPSDMQVVIGQFESSAKYFRFTVPLTEV